MVTSLFNSPKDPPTGTFGLAYTSFATRSRRPPGAADNSGPAFPAETFIEMCKSFGADGCQMDYAQLTSTSASYLKRIREATEKRGLWVELSVSSRLLGDPDAFAGVASAAGQLGVSRLRVALLSGRRYETFKDMSTWKEFVNKSRQILSSAEPLLRQHKLICGIENHKDWLAGELVEILRGFSSPYLGACVDFGNNVALLEDSLELAGKLAPYVVTTHVKDMALARYDDGFLLSEVPLGEGVLPLGKIIETLRKARGDVHLCLEMITRDPLKVPYLKDGYWVTYEKRDQARIKKFESSILAKASAQPLPEVSGLTRGQTLAVEDENIRRCVVHAKRNLGL
jgi:sugar phosphate isomerase/epimerase